jgi:hypothetical protein
MFSAGRAQQAHRLQKTANIATVRLQGLDIARSTGRREQRVRKVDAAVVLERLQADTRRGIPRFRQGDQSQQRVGHALAGGQHHAHLRIGRGFDNVGDPSDARGIRDGRTAELVNHPSARCRHFFENSSRYRPIHSPNSLRRSIYCPRQPHGKPNP